MLQLTALRKAYGDTVALDGVTFAVEPGQMLGFVGPNGAGKTTAMRITLGVLAPDSGEVRWCGAEIDAQVRRRFGYMPEERGLYPKMRVLDQLVYLARLHGLGAADAAGAAAYWIDRVGLGERAHDRVEALSLGNQQRVQLAAALVHGPELLVLDEPFSGLDPVGVDVMAGVLSERVAAGVAVVFSSHQLELVERLCEAVAIIRRGRLVAWGNVDDLRRRGRARRVRISVAAPPGWADAVPGTRVVESYDGSAVLELAEGVELARVLDHARAAGPVTHFSEVEPGLAELFREVAA